MKRLLAALVGLALALVGTVAVAAWLSTGSASATVSATTVDQANAPTATRGSGSVTLSWNASTLANNSPVGGYHVVRHSSTGSETVCSAVAPALTCDDLHPLGGAVSYGVVATVGSNWAGPESTTTAFTYDIVKPNTTASVSPQPNAAGWNKDSVTVTLTATDPAISSGLDHVTYTVDRGSAVDVPGDTASFPVTSTGSHMITYFAVDQAGNTEDTKTATVRIDPDAPLITNLQPATGASGSWSAIRCGGANRVCADVSDATSGIATSAVTFSLARASGANNGKCWNGSAFVVGPCAQQPMSALTGSTYGSPTTLTSAAMAAGGYSLVVTATDVADNVITATSTFTVKADQTITFTSTAPSNATVGRATYAVTATASSGLTVSFSSATPSVCTVSGSTVSFMATGTCTINADQAGDATYNAAPQVQQSFTVRADQTITFGALSDRTYGDASFAVSATASSGLSVAFSSATTSVCTVIGSNVTIVAAGTCTINADQAGNATYNAAPQVQQSFKVAKANQTITFTSTAPSSASTGTTYTPTATATSGLTVSFAVSGACSISSGTVTFGPAAGTCTIKADQAGNTNWNAATQKTQSVTVTLADTTKPSIANIMDGRSPLTWQNDNNGNGSWNQDACSGNQVCATTTDSGTGASGINASAIYFTLTGTSGTNANKCWNGSSFSAVSGSGTSCQATMSYSSSTGRITASVAQSNMLNGGYSLKIHVEDNAGNVSEQTVSLTLN